MSQQQETKTVLNPKATKSNTSAQANPNPIIIYAAVAIGSILIYKYFIKK